jgi:hypothetical protein
MIFFSIRKRFNSEVKLIYKTFAISGSVNSLVMNNHQLAIQAQMNVEFNSVNMQVNCF